MSLGGPLLRVFVYGTLKRGHRNHDRYCVGVVAVEPACLAGRLYHLPQGYPMLVIPAAQVLALGSADGIADARRQKALSDVQRRPQRADDGKSRRLIQGELLTFDDPGPRLVALDGLEGYSPRTAGGEYQRALVELAEPAGELAWTYIAPQGRLPLGATPCGAEWRADSDRRE